MVPDPKADVVPPCPPHDHKGVKRLALVEEATVGGFHLRYFGDVSSSEHVNLTTGDLKGYRQYETNAEKPMSDRSRQVHFAEAALASAIIFAFWSGGSGLP